MCIHVHMSYWKLAKMKNIGILNGKKSNIAHPQHLGKYAVTLFIIWSYCSVLNLDLQQIICISTPPHIIDQVKKQPSTLV